MWNRRSGTNNASTSNLNWYDSRSSSNYDNGDIAWLLCATALVMLMVPGVGFFYCGLLRRKHALSMLYLSMTSLSVASLQWWLWGYSLTYSESANPFIGDLKHIALQNVFDQTSPVSPRVPANVFCLYQLMFAAFTPTLAVGGFSEHARLGPVSLFVFAWSTLVYDPIACWTWNPKGWARQMGDFDWAGGTPVHISSGSAALAISIYLRPRDGYRTPALDSEPHNSTYVVLGTALLWFGWFGFNGGSALSADLHAVQACLVTHLAACSGGITWLLWDYHVGKRWSVVGFCSGAISGLITITPAAGFIKPPLALVFGFVGGSACNFGTRLKLRFGYDDCLDVFSSHAIGGVLGNLLTGIFAQISAGAPGRGGWLDGNFVQLAYQAASSAACLFYSLIITGLILVCFERIPGLDLRTSSEAQKDGVDMNDMGESAYHDVCSHSEEGCTASEEQQAPPPTQSVPPGPHPGVATQARPMDQAPPEPAIMLQNLGNNPAPRGQR